MGLVRRESNLPLMKIRKAETRALEAVDDGSSAQTLEKHFERHWASIYRLLARMLGDPAEAEDLALEAFYRLYRVHPKVGPEFNIRAWLYRVATNLGLQSIRSLKRRERYESAAGQRIIEEAPEDRPAEILASEEERHTARRALAGMNARQSQLLILRYAGASYKEIAEAMQLSPHSIGPLLLRAEREFEKRYRDLAQEEP